MTFPRTLISEVFGRVVDLRRSRAGWQVFYAGSEGKRVPAGRREAGPQ